MQEKLFEETNSSPGWLQRSAQRVKKSVCRKKTSVESQTKRLNNNEGLPEGWLQESIDLAHEEAKQRAIIEARLDKANPLTGGLSEGWLERSIARAKAEVAARPPELRPTRRDIF